MGDGGVAGLSTMNPRPPRFAQKRAAEFDQLAGEYDVLLEDPLRDAFAGSSDFFHRRKWDLIQRHLAKMHLDPCAKAWLDVGCGRGELLGLGADRFATATGCDPSQEMLRCGRGQVVWQPDPSQLPFDDARFDFVTAVCVFHHVAEEYQGRLMGEMFRVLRPGGIACVIEHNRFNPATRWIVARTPVDFDAHLMSAGQVMDTLGAAGFQTHGAKYFLYLPESIYRRLSRMENYLEGVPAGGQYAVFARKAGDTR